ncbi:MAG: tRNA guanosine(15) transglycosylase TgtA [Candidatus Altiarchaeales archaeon]|nr:MAG: tRNA guanosine(15) transglycosylase TgtA [Candidatus Altiarchaeales archaeon]
MIPELNFEIREKDIGARIGRLEINCKRIETPTIMPVINPLKEIISIEELHKDFNVEILMTNAYILLKNENLRETVLKKGIHKFLGFDGVIATDSGSFQLMQYGNVLTTNKEIIDFQERIGSDIGSFLDIPSLPDTYKARAEEQLELTLKRAEEAKYAKFVVNAGIQGSTYLDLRKKAARKIGKDFQLCAVGGIVGIMEDYRFSDLVDIIATVKKNIPLDRVVHAFGLGHPVVFSLAIALGCDLFDSAAYALYANELRYMTETGTKKLNELKYIPCNCPVCSKYDLELKELEKNELIKELARHNLYVTFEELKRIKEAIYEGNLWNLLSIRMRSHPNLLSGLERLLKYNKYLAEIDKITNKSAFYYLGRESKHRTEIINVKRRLKRVSSNNLLNIPPFGFVPLELTEIYPFISTITPESKKRDDIPHSIPDIKKVRAMMEYQFGRGAGELISDNAIIKKSRKTGRMRWIYEDNELIASIRASDNWILPKEKLAKRLHKRFPYPMLRVVIDEEAVPFIMDGKSVFCKFVLDIDKNLRCMDEVLIVDVNDNLIRTGTLYLSPREIVNFRYGVAVRVR